METPSESPIGDVLSETRQRFAVQVLQSLPWFSDTRARRDMAASAMSGEGSFGAVEVHTALQAAHKLVWDHELMHGAGLRCPFPHKLGNHPC